MYNTQIKNEKEIGRTKTHQKKKKEEDGFETHKKKKKKARRRRRKQEEEGSETQKKKKKEVRFFFFFFCLNQNLVPAEICISAKLAGLAETPRNRPKFDLRWNEGYYGTGFHAGTKYSGRSGMNGTESITMV